MAQVEPLREHALLPRIWLIRARTSQNVVDPDFPLMRIRIQILASK
jgi:hypothetical protein